MHPARKLGIFLTAATLAAALAVPATATAQRGPAFASLVLLLQGGEQQNEWQLDDLGVDECGQSIHSTGSGRETIQFIAGSTPINTVTTGGQLVLPGLPPLGTKIVVTRSGQIQSQSSPSGALARCLAAPTSAQRSRGSLAQSSDDCGTKPGQMDLLLTPVGGSLEVKAMPGINTPLFSSCPYRGIAHPDLVPAVGSLPQGTFFPGPVSVPLNAVGGPVPVTDRGATGSSRIQLGFVLTGYIVPLVSVPSGASTLRPDRRGRAKLPLSCSKAGACRGTVSLRVISGRPGRAGPRVRRTQSDEVPTKFPAGVRNQPGDFARTHFSLARGKRKTLRLRLGAAAFLRGRALVVVRERAGRKIVTYAVRSVTLRGRSIPRIPGRPR